MLCLEVDGTADNDRCAFHILLCTPVTDFRIQFLIFLLTYLVHRIKFCTVFIKTEGIPVHGRLLLTVCAFVFGHHVIQNCHSFAQYKVLTIQQIHVSFREHAAKPSKLCVSSKKGHILVNIDNPVPRSFL